MQMAADAGAGKTLYVCPMHAEVVSDAPGKCPKCHMTLVPLQLPPLDPAPRPKAAADPKTQVYTCPMHPEVRHLGPGTCPKCGMALEPVKGAP
jgi:Cu+-exporting ATPase